MRSQHRTDIVPEFHAEAPQATVSEGLAQGPYVAARAGYIVQINVYLHNTGLDQITVVYVHQLPFCGCSVTTGFKGFRSAARFSAAVGTSYLAATVGLLVAAMV